jgi:hypothetical protein
MKADCYIFTRFGVIRPGEVIPEEKPVEVTGNDEGAVEETAPVEAPKPKKRQKKAN